VSKRANVARVLALLLTGALVGLVGGRYMPRPKQLHELGPRLAAEADQLFANLQKNKVKRHIKLRIIDCWDVDVAIVGEFLGADLGFARVAEVPPFFWVDSDGFEVWRYDEHHLFITITDWYQRDLRRNALEADEER
jgi:hypothetical protein